MSAAKSVKVVEWQGSEQVEREREEVEKKQSQDDDTR